MLHWGLCDSSNISMHCLGGIILTFLLWLICSQEEVDMAKRIPWRDTYSMNEAPWVHFLLCVLLLSSDPFTQSQVTRMGSMSGPSEHLASSVRMRFTEVRGSWTLGSNVQPSSLWCSLQSPSEFPTCYRRPLSIHITGSLSSNQLDPKKEKETLVFLGVCVPGPIEVVSCHSVNSGEPLG